MSEFKLIHQSQLDLMTKKAIHSGVISKSDADMLIAALLREREAREYAEGFLIDFELKEDGFHKLDQHDNQLLKAWKAWSISGHVRPSLLEFKDEVKRQRIG